MQVRGAQSENDAEFFMKIRNDIEGWKGQQPVTLQDLGDYKLAPESVGNNVTCDGKLTGGNGGG